MYKKFYSILISTVFLFYLAKAQTPVACTTLGQTPGTAFPVCGTDTFSIQSVDICGNYPVPAKCNITVTDKNPYYYKFTCFTAGSLAFVITPKNLNDDYDWQLFDVTNHRPTDLYNDASLFVASSWSGDPGLTGAGPTGTSLENCDGLGVPRFSRMPNLVQGHEYILLISHFTDSQSGYSLSFNGGTAGITDPVVPALSSAKGSCDGTEVILKLNKEMKCSSLAANGSDFSISSALATVTGAAGINCATGFDMDSLVIKLSAPLPPGNYTLKIETGTDGNNLLDNCNRGIPNGQTVPFTVLPITPTPMDSLTTPGCAPNMLQLVFKDEIVCSSIAADGSDFVVTGSTAVSIQSATGICTGGLTNIVQVTLSTPVQRAGSFKITLKPGSDGNTLLNKCGGETAAGSALSFITYDTVFADIRSILRGGCSKDTVDFSNNANNGINKWSWDFGNSIQSNTQNYQVIYSTEGTKNATLIVSNGHCADTGTVSIQVGTRIKAAFEGTSVVCPGDPATFLDKSAGPVVNWTWNFGNGFMSTLQQPAGQFYPASLSLVTFPVQLIVRGSSGCADTVLHTITVPPNCYIAVPKAFSPNNDGLNDYLYPTNAYKAGNLLFRIYNRGGQKIFETRDWMTKWDGTLNGNPQNPGTYVWTLIYTDIETGKKFELKGSTVLIR